jgi:hypothetical protein
MTLSFRNGEGVEESAVVCADGVGSVCGSLTSLRISACGSDAAQTP